MPHVVIEGDISPRETWEAFRPLMERRGEQILKVERAFLEKEQRTVLLECLAVTGTFRQKFLVQVSRKDPAGVTVRLEPLTDPEKTDAVHRVLALTARWVLGLKPDLALAATNLAAGLEGDG